MSGSNEHPTSTLQSFVDSATGAVQGAISSLTGNPADKREADNTKGKAEAEHDLSQASVKAGPFTATPGGGLAKDNENRTEGSWNQTIGAGKEAIGGFVGADGLRQEGQRQNAEGKGQEAQGQLSDLGKGISDRVGGTVGGAFASAIGSPGQKDAAQRQHDDGKARQRGVESDLRKEDESRRN